MSKPKLLVTGAAGMLGTHLLDYFKNKYEVHATGSSTGWTPDFVSWHLCDLAQPQNFKSLLQQIRPSVIIHSAAMINIDACEKDPEQASVINVESTRIASEYAREYSASLVFISTDCMYEGNAQEPYRESDPPNPMNIYAKTKVEAEAYVTSTEKGIALRTNIFGWSQRNKTSFGEWVLKGLQNSETLNMFTDVFYNPVSTGTLCEVIDRLLQKKASGLFNATGNTILSKYDFGIMVAKAFGFEHHKIVPASVDRMNFFAKRPKYMALSNEKLTQTLDWKLPDLDQDIQNWKAMLESGWVGKIKNNKIKNVEQLMEIL